MKVIKVNYVTRRSQKKIYSKEMRVNINKRKVKILICFHRVSDNYKSSFLWKM